MTPKGSVRLADSIEHSASDLIAELQAVRDGVEELHILLDHIWRNRNELRDILADLVESGRVQAPDAFPLEDAGHGPDGTADKGSPCRRRDDAFGPSRDREEHP